MLGRDIVALVRTLAVAGLVLLAGGTALRAQGLMTAFDPASAVEVDHAVWDRMLAVYRVPGSDGIARFAYGRVSAADRAALRGYVDALAAVPVSRLNRAEQFAYWVNLYNALTIDVVLQHYPVASIREIDISPGLFDDGPWGAELVVVEGTPLGLDDIEHRILRPIWRDPRIHYAVNCASIGCPDLAPRAFVAGEIEPMLEEGARAFVNHPRGARIAADGLRVSSIYAWFREDFGDSESGVVEHLRRYADPPLAAGLEGVREIAGDDYDWSLNDAR